MNFIESNGNFQMSTGNIVSHEKLPAGYYKINYDERHDIFSLDRTYEFTLNESKIYGVQIEKMNKVVNSFEKIDRSLGVLLTGDKGIGKSLFAKLTCMELFSKGYPIIIIDKAYKGLEKFLSEIPGEIVMYFDEFDKVFEKSGNSDGRDVSTQESLLTFFDGTGSQKRLFIVTANEIDNLNDCILNRPGRFHYHLIFAYPTENEIIEYLKDNMDEFNDIEAQKVVRLAKMININYDALRSICFEYNLGIGKLEDFINDLNIKSNTYRNKYKFTFTSTEGAPVVLFSCGSSGRSLFIELEECGNFDLSTNKYRYSSSSTIEFNAETKLSIVENEMIITNYKLDFDDDLIKLNIDPTKPVRVENSKEIEAIKLF